ncbi:MAG: hypothetical protein QG615_636, partial [Nitrospirota bacterium]|nr:hypothetical protein [Nitrospirota bacterium]
MRLPIMDLGLSSGESHVLTVIRQLNAHFLTDLLEDLRCSLQFQRVRIANCQHGVLMPLLSTNGHGAAVRPCTNHFQRKIGIVTVNADENTGLNLVAPD